MVHLLLAITATIWFTAASASAITIAELVANGATLSGQSVTVTGNVTGPALDGVGETTFNLIDANGQRVSIFGKTTHPALGSAVTVSGLVGYKAPDEEFIWPPVVHDATW